MQVAAQGAVPTAATRVIVAQIYQKILLTMIEDLEKRKPEAIEWFKYDLENVALVAHAAGFKPESVLHAISYPLRRGQLSQVLKRIAGFRKMLAGES